MYNSIKCYFMAVSTSDIEFILLSYIFVISFNFDELKLVLLFFTFNKFLS